MLQIGSLVIALPSCHQGGALRVEHGSTVQLFDFGAALAQRPAEPLLQWAAFYSDCKHEVLLPLVLPGQQLALAIIT